MKKNFRVFEYDIDSDDEQNDRDIINTFVLRNLTLEEMEKFIDDNYGHGSPDVSFKEVK